MRGSCSFLCAALAVAVVRAPATAQPNSDATRFFENEVRPLLAKTCFKCHGPAKQEAGLRLDSRDGMLKGGEHGAALVPSEPDRSLLLHVVRQQGEVKMPPGGKLKDEQIAVLARWVKMGAPWPQEAKIGGLRSGPPSAEERRFWSSQPIRDTAAPPVKDAAWPRNDVDRFILAAREANSLRPAPPADRRTLLRRAAFDLTGLPPAPEEIDAF